VTGIAVLAIRFAASLIAIGLLALLARWLGLGGDLRIRDDAQARDLAREAVPGFEPAEIAIDRAGIGALLRDAAGRVLLLRRHGTHFAARLLDSHAETRLDHNFLTIATSDRSFGAFTLDLGPQAQIWAGSFRRLGG
jgi:hypothetical protein